MARLVLTMTMSLDGFFSWLKVASDPQAPADQRDLAGALNNLRQGVAEPQLDGLGIHYVHARAVNPAGPVLPLVLCHGWPDSFWRYTKVIPLLTDPGAHGGDPADAFDVVVPDMPGYGYSDRPTGPPLDTIAVAGLWARLLDGLGYWGAAEGAYMARLRRRHLTVLHDGRDPHQHHDLLAHPDHRLVNADVPRERPDPPAQQARRVEVPSGFTQFPANISRAPRTWLERTTNLVRFTQAPLGGHFAPLEESEFYAEELRAFFRPYRA